MHVTLVSKQITQDLREQTYTITKAKGERTNLGSSYCNITASGPTTKNNPS